MRRRPRPSESHLPFLDVLQLAAEGLAAFGHLALHHQVVAVCPQCRCGWMRMCGAAGGAAGGTAGWCAKAQCAVRSAAGGWRDSWVCGSGWARTDIDDLVVGVPHLAQRLGCAQRLDDWPGCMRPGSRSRWREGRNSDDRAQHGVDVASSLADLHAPWWRRASNECVSLYSSACNLSLSATSCDVHDTSSEM